MNPSGYVLSDATASELRVMELAAAMTLVKTAVMDGTTLHYTYTVTNTGALDIHAVTLTDSAASFTGTGTAPVPSIDAATTGTADDDGILGVAEVWTYRADYTPTQSDRDTGRLSNRASVSGLNPSNAAVTDVSDDGAPTDADQDGQTANDPTVTRLAQNPALQLVKTSSLNAGQILYTYVLTNTGDVTLQSPTLSERSGSFTGTGTRPVPAIDAATTGTADDDGLLDVGESWTYTASYTLTQTDIDTGAVSNSASASARDPQNAPVSDLSDNGDEAVDADNDGLAGNDPTVTELPRTPAVELVKTATATGSVVTYTYAVTNTGTVTLRNVVVTESAEDFTGTGTRPTAALDPALTGSADDDGELDVGETWTYTAQYTVTDADYLAGTLSNSAAVSATDPTAAAVTDTSDDGNPADSVADADNDGSNDPTQTAITMQPSIALVKTASLVQGGLAYRYSVTNTGNVGLTAVLVAETGEGFSGTGPLPVPVLDDAATGTADDDGILNPGESWVYTAGYELTGEDIGAGFVTNSATVDALDPAEGGVSDISDNGDATDGPDTPTLTTLTSAPEIALVKTASVSGSTVTYRYDVQNTGNVPLSGVTLSEDEQGFTGTGLLPHPLPDAALTGTADDDGTLDAGETWVFTATYTLTQDDIDSGTIRNSASVAATNPDQTRTQDVSDDGDPADSAADADTDGTNDPTVTAIPADAQMELTKTAAADGQDIVYTYVLRNTGNVTLASVSLDESAAHFSGNGALPVPALDAAATNGAADDHALNVGESWTYTARYTPTAADRAAGTLSNSATASATDPSGTPLEDTSDNGDETADADNNGLPGDDPTETAVPTAPALQITHVLTDLKRRFTNEYAATFRITLTNAGNIRLTDLSLANDLAAFVSAQNLIGTPVLTKHSGPGALHANGGFDGAADTEILTGATLDPQESAEFDVTFRFDVTNGFPQGDNLAAADADELAAAVDDADGLAVSDDDGDGAVDTTESATADRDGDGVSDAEDYDPTGYFYCESDGRILSGGSVLITKQGGGSNGSVGTANGITIAQDGSSGYYQWFVDSPGTYTMALTYPPGATPSTTRLPSSSALDVTTLLPADPAFIGSTEVGATGVLADASLGANPAFYLTFDIEAGDPAVMANNIPVTDCATSSAGITVTDHDLTAGEENGDTGDMGFVLTKAPLAPVTLDFSGDAECRVEPASMTFTPDNWATEQRLTVIGRKDDRAEDPHTCTPTVQSSSTDPAYDGLTPPLSDVLLADSLIDAVADQVREKLTEDMAQTLGARMAEFREISAGASQRLAEPVPESCQTTDRLAPHGSIDGAGGALQVAATLSGGGDACQLENRRIVQSRLSVNRSVDGGTSVDLSGDILRETRLSDSRLRGRFIGGYLRLPAGADSDTGRIRAFGVHAGLYGAERRGNGVMTDHYLAFGLGRHDYDFSFGTVAPITATGDYGYAALYGGVALSQQAQTEHYVLTPRIGIDLAYAVPTDATITARQGAATETGTVTLEPLGLARLFAEFGVAPQHAPAGFGLATTDWSLTPSVFCDARLTGTALDDTGGCGFGIDLQFDWVSPDQRRKWSLGNTVEHGPSGDTLTFTLRHTRRIAKDGQVETTMTVTPDGAIIASETLTLRF